MRLACPADFYDGSIYTHYRWHPGFARRARLLADFPDPVLVAGCAFGYLVAELQCLGKRVYGIDASWWAVQQRVSSHVTCASILYPPFRPGVFATVITEDLLPCLTNDEVQLAAQNCASLARIVIHLVTEQGQADLNYHSTGYWMNLTKQLTISLEGM